MAIRAECLDYKVSNEWKLVKTYLTIGESEGLGGDLLTACDLIRDNLLQKYSLDVKESNVMYRGKTMVITDPISMSSLSDAEFMELSETTEDEDEIDFSNLPPVAAVKALVPLFVAAAQAQYDQWTVLDDDEIGFQDTYAGGGICHLIADDLCAIMGEHGIDCTTVSSSHEQHVYCVAQCRDGVFEVDVPWRNYETGGGFSWKRIDGVVFDPDYISIYKLSSDPSDFQNYIDE